MKPIAGISTSVFFVFSLILSGCQSMIENTTPRTLPQNPSNVYAISLRMHNVNRKIADESYEAHIVIDGRDHKMTKENRHFFVFDYKPDGYRCKATYYFDVNYTLGGLAKTSTSEIYELNIISRYVIGFECNRGRPHARVSLLGRGFVDGDQIEIGGVPCDTEFISQNVLAFTVPFMEGGKAYQAILSSENGDIGLGNFFIDKIGITAIPSALNLQSGDKQLITLSTDMVAPKFGIALDVTTDIPESIIMPEVSIYEGARSVDVLIEGGKAGSGTLFIAAPGFEECKIPVTVENDSQFDGSSDLTDDLAILN